MSDVTHFTPGKRRWKYVFLAIAFAALIVVVLFAVGKRGPDPVRRRTLAQLRVLGVLMEDYLAEGNPEPKPPSPWIYAGASVPPGYVETSPASDPIHWIAALRSVPEITKKLDAMSFSSDKGVSKRMGSTAVKGVLPDAWGTPIRFVPSDTRTGKPRYFMSAGPDGKFSMMVGAGGTAMRADEIYSTDPG